MTSEKIKLRIEECATLFSFRYYGKDGNIDPYYIPESKSYEYLLYFDGSEMTVHSLDDVMTTPFFAGKSLSEIAEEIEIDEY